jgi:hypothetical protein
MARLDEQRRELAGAVRASRATENELTPAQARLFVRGLQTSWQVPPIAWSARESREQFEDARRLLHAAGIFRDLDGAGSAEALSCYRRAAELLEWLARSSDAVTRDVPVALLAAGAYQLASLPAMATSLLRQGGFGEGVAEIFAAFLSADFERLLRRSATRLVVLTGAKGFTRDILAEACARVSDPCSKDGTRASSRRPPFGERRVRPGAVWSCAFLEHTRPASACRSRARRRAGVRGRGWPHAFGHGFGCHGGFCPGNGCVVRRSGGRACQDGERRPVFRPCGRP